MVSLRSIRRGLARVLTAAAVMAGAGLATVTVAPSALADSTTSMESQFVADMNAARQANGLRPYVVASDLTSVAREHSAQMASRQELYHNPNLTTQVQNWQAVGENVGEGPTVDDIHQAFMHSPEHRANILDHDFTQVGVGVSVDSNGTIWVTEDFREPMQSSSTTTTHHSSPSRTPTTTTRTTTHHATAASAPAANKPAAPTQRTSAAPRVVQPVATPNTPSQAQTPQARLLARITAAQTAVASAPSADPVSQAFDYLDAVSTVANG